MWILSNVSKSSTRWCGTCWRRCGSEGAVRFLCTTWKMQINRTCLTCPEKHICDTAQMHYKMSKSPVIFFILVWKCTGSMEKVNFPCTKLLALIPQDSCSITMKQKCVFSSFTLQNLNPISAQVKCKSVGELEPQTCQWILPIVIKIIFLPHSHLSGAEADSPEQIWQGITTPAVFIRNNRRKK